VEDGLDFTVMQNLRDMMTIGKIAFDERSAQYRIGKASGEIIEDGDAMPGFQQMLDHM
jgi:hypothetical protein